MRDVGYGVRSREMRNEECWVRGKGPRDEE